MNAAVSFQLLCSLRYDDEFADDIDLINDLATSSDAGILDLDTAEQYLESINTYVGQIYILLAFVVGVGFGSLIVYFILKPIFYFLR